MIRDLGIIPPGTTLYVPFHTFDSNDPSASVTLSGLATSDIEIYKDGGTTQRASDAGYDLLDTDGIDFDGITGIHGLSINLANNDTAGFYAAGSQYWVVVSSVTVDAATINFILCTFRIGYPDSLLNTTIASLTNQTSFTLTAGPAENDALNGCVVLIHDVASAVQKGFAVVLDYTGASKTVTLVAGTTFTVAATDNISFYPPIASPQLTTIASDLVQVYSDTTIATSKTTQIYSDTAITSSKAVQVYSDTTAIHTQTTTAASKVVQIYSDTTIVVSDTTHIDSDTTRIESKAVQIYSDTTVIEAAGGGLTAAQDSKLTRVNSKSTQVYSDTTFIASKATQIYSDTTAIEAAGGALTAAQDSKLTRVNSKATQIYSDTTAIHTQTTTAASKVVQIYSDTTIAVSKATQIYSDTTAIHTQTTTAASKVVQIYSDTTIATSKTTQIYSDTAIASSKAVQIYSDSTAIHSDTTAVHSDTTAIHSDTTITSSKAVQVYSDTTMIASKATQIYSDTTLIAADGPNTPTKGVELADVLIFMVDESDFATPETGVTLTVTISKDGGAFAACTNSASEISGGWYKITLTAAEMGADSIAIKATGTGCAQRNIHFRTQPT